MKMMTSGTFFSREVLPFAGMFTSECLNVGLNTIYKAAVTKGLNYHVYMTYTYAGSSLFLLALVWLFHRKTTLPPLNKVLLGKFFILGMLGFSLQVIGYLGVSYSSPTMTSAMSNLTPVSTFILAVIFRMEKLKLKSISSQAKIIGAVVSISGALVVVFYNGPMIINGNQKDLISTTTILSDARSNWILGGALCASCYFLVSIYFIFLSKLLKEYPAECIIIFFDSFVCFLLSVPVGIALEPNLSSWILPADIRMLAVLYAGIASGTIFTLACWGTHVKGPVYVTMFKPLSIAIAAIAGVLFLNDNLYVGSVSGSAIITVGFYTTMWGKVKEEIIEEPNNDDVESAADDVIVPLLKK